MSEQQEVSYGYGKIIRHHPHSENFDQEKIPRVLISKLEIHLANKNFDMARHLIDQEELRHKKFKNAILDSKISSLPIDPVTIADLRRAGVETIRSLVALHRSDFYGDDDAADMIEAALKNLGLCLRRDDDASPATKNS